MAVQGRKTKTTAAKPTKKPSKRPAKKPSEKAGGESAPPPHFMGPIVYNSGIDLGLSTSGHRIGFERDETPESDRMISYEGDSHICTVAPTRSGKGVNVVIPNLLTYEGSVVVFDLKGELRKTVAWLRGTQDLKTGSYAGGVEGTAWVLAVLADCPDHYRRVDGPFVAKAR